MLQVLAAMLSCGHSETRQNVRAELLSLLDQAPEEWAKALVGSAGS